MNWKSFAHYFVKLGDAQMGLVFESCRFGMLCFRIIIFLDLFSPFINELVDVITDTIYFHKVTQPNYEKYLHTQDFVYQLLMAFAIIGMVKFVYLIYLTGKTVRSAEMEGIKEELLCLRFTDMILTFLFEGTGIFYYISIRFYLIMFFLGDQ